MAPKRLIIALFSVDLTTAFKAFTYRWVKRIKEMITNLRRWWLLSKFFLSAPKAMYTKEFGEYR